jgi:sulfotransferase family protein
MNPYVFIVGCPRSGTTLLQRMVDAHPQIAITPETHWIPRYFQRRIGVTPGGTVTTEFIDRLLEYERFTKLNIGHETLATLMGSSPEMSYSSFVSKLFDAYGQNQSKTLVGDKTPGYVENLALLHALWPHSKFVHLIRDGRDVCLSLRNWSRGEKTCGRFSSWAEDPVATAAFWWKRLVQVGQESGAALGPNLYYELRYESLVHQPEQECSALCEFLAVKYHDAMLRFFEGRTREELGLSSKDAWLPPTPRLRDWRKEMPLAEVERFEAAAGDLLDTLGYARLVPVPAGEQLEHAARIGSSFTDEIRNRGLPRRWLVPNSV